MSHICERVDVARPAAEAAQRLHAYIRARGDAAGSDDTIRVPLRLPIFIFGRERTVLERTVIATLAPLHTAADDMPVYSVVWSDADHGLFPTFAGALAAEHGVDDAHFFGLVVTGHYEPPGGFIGGAFDAAIGQRVARTSALDLLHRIARSLEAG